MAVDSFEFDIVPGAVFACEILVLLYRCVSRAIGLSVRHEAHLLLLSRETLPFPGNDGASLTDFHVLHIARSKPILHEKDVGRFCLLHQTLILDPAVRLLAIGGFGLSSKSQPRVVRLLDLFWRE